MADRLIFPIGFDLEAAVKQAQGDADRLLRKLETTIKSRPLAINLKIDNAGAGSINEINNRMGELVKQWNSLTEAERIHNKKSGEFTPQAKRIIAEYVRLTGATESYARSLQQLSAAARRAANEQEKNLEKQRKLDILLKSSEHSIANVTAKLQHYKKEMNAADVGSVQFSKAAAEVKRLTARLTELQAKVQTATGIAKNEVNSVTKEMEKQDGYVSRLVKRLAVYASFSAVGNLLTSIREVTAEFELQRVSLGAIIQDQQRANELFSEIKAFALKSPLKILDLTKYTKQVAAYRIEQDKLFDTTRRLADVSVGLGVDMGRIVLAYGQVKAASYLRAAEIRQFTEAGIPMLELLAEKFSELSGTAVSTEEVMDKVSKRMVAFSMVEEIFEDMTSAGGMFYNMQEKQSQTLYGMWAKMGDAAAVMYEQMGNTAVANGAMKETIQLMSDMMLHWTALANTAQTAIVGFGLYKAAMAGLVPGFDLVYKKILNQTMAEKRKQAVMAETMSIGRAYTLEEARSVATKNQLIAADYKKILTENKFSAAKLVGMARQAAYNAELRKAIIELGLFSNAQITALGKMKGWQFFFAKLNAQIGFFTKRQIVQWNTLGSGIKGWWGKIKLIGTGIKQVAATAGKAIGGMVAAYAPLLGLTAVIDLFMDWRNAVAAQEEAVKKVDKQYEEMKVTLMEIKNAYDEIKNATKEAGVSEDEFIKTSYSQKLEQLKKVIKLLGNFGMKNVIDPSVLNYTNIDPVLDKWLNKLNEVNELARGWGREVALVANAYEGNIFGWSIFGENLKEDMKDLERSWTKLTVNPQFNQNLAQMKATIGDMANNNKDAYDRISKAIGADAKLALAQRRRNESELQYQQRIYKNFIAIGKEMGHSLFGTDWAAMANVFEETVLADFQSDVDEVMHEFDKIKEKFRDQDALSVKMAIDTIAAENDWTEWQKELLIQHLNEDPITLNAEIIPTGNVAGQGAVAEGLKSIIETEFPKLFSKEDLASLVSAEGIVDAIEGKLQSANEKLDKAYRLQNNIGKGSAREKMVLSQIDELQKEITDITSKRAELAELDARKNELTSEELERHTQLTAELQNTDKDIIKTNQTKIAALVQQNDKYNEQIDKLKEIAKEERDAAKAALERVTASELSSLGADVKQAFPQLQIDEDKQRDDGNYFSRYLVSDDDLKKVNNVVDLYDLWAKQTKAIADDKTKMVGVGMSEETVAKAVADVQAKRTKDEQELANINEQIKNSNLEALAARYDELVYAKSLATSVSEQQTAESNLNKFLREGVTAEAAKLFVRRQNLNYAIRESAVAEKANQQIIDNIAGLEDAEKFWEELGKRYNFKLLDKDKGRGSGEDPWIILMKNRMKFMQDFQKGVEDLSKWMGYTKGLVDEQENMLGRGLSVQIDSRKLDGSKDELIKWYEDAIEQIRSKIAKMGGKEWEGLGVQMILAKDTKSRVIKKYQELLQEMWKNLTDFRTDQAQKAIEQQLKTLADRISRTKTAKEFYEKILGQTGDVQLAATLSIAVYGSNGKELRQQVIDEIQEILGKDKKGQLLEFAAAVRKDKSIDYDELVRIAKGYQDIGEISTETYNRILKMRDEDRKDFAKTIDGWLKATEKAKSYSDKLLDLENKTSTQIATIGTRKRQAQESLSMFDEEVNPEEVKKFQDLISFYDTQIKGLRERQAKEKAKLMYESFKDTPMYVQMFDDLDHASTRMLENMKSRLEGMRDNWNNLEPTQLKELQSRLNEIDSQLAKRNPFKTLADGFRKWRDLRRKGDGSTNNAGKGSKSEKEAGQYLIDTARKADQARALFSEALEKYQVKDGETLEEMRERYGKDGLPKDLAEAKNELDEAMSNEEAAQRAVENWKKVKDTIGLSANELFQMLNWAGDIAKGIADISEAMGADKEDVQYWNDVASALGEISGGIQSIVTAAMSGDVVGIISSAITAIPKMFVGFVNLFSAGKIRRANKEIGRLEERLERLEYTYGRLEKAAEKAFGADYVRNIRQQEAVLKAQAAAYEKMAKAERSKGKKADKDKIKEFTNAQRDALNELADLQGQVAERMLGTDLTSAARDFAQAWIDAYKEFGNTADAMSGKFHEMIENMVVESVLARAMENALAPVFKMIDSYNGSYDNAEFWQRVMEQGEIAVNQMDAAGRTVMEIVKSWGYDPRATSDSSLTGIKRDIATASEESINGLAVGLNTQNFYSSQQLAEVQAIRRLLEQGGSPLPAATDYVDVTELRNAAMGHLSAISQHTAETVTECRRIALAAEAEVAQLKRVIVNKATDKGYGVAVYMRG